MNKNLNTTFFDLAILLALAAISLGIWFYPWLTVAVLGLVMLGGFLSSKPWAESPAKPGENPQEAHQKARGQNQ